MPIPPVLETKRLILRPLRITDAESYAHYLNDWEIIRYLGKGVPWPYTVELAKEFIAGQPDNSTCLLWGITVKDRGEHSDEVIGAIELYLNQDDSHRGFWLGKTFHNNGLMTEAAEAITDYWFNDLGRSVLRLRNATQNPASTRIKQKSCAKFVGIVEKQYMDPAFNQAEIWEITADEWRAFRSQDNTK